MKRKYSVFLAIILSFSVIACNDLNKSDSEKKSETPTVNELPGDHSVLTQVLSEAVGTANLGNTCFANSVHKLIWSYLRNSKEKVSFPLNTDLQRDFYSFIKMLDLKMDQVYINPKKVSELNTKDPFFANSLNKIFAGITQSLLITTGFGSISGKVITEDQIDADEYFRGLSDFLKLNHVQNSFFISSQITLKDGTKKPIYTESLKPGTYTKNIYYPINLIKDVNNFNDLINANLKETIDGYYDTDTKITQSVEKQTYFSLKDTNKAPNRIILNLKRFTQNGTTLVKNSDFIAIPDFFPIHFSSLKDDLTSSVLKFYKVKAVVVHHGTLDGGHYYVYLKENDKWYKHNDSDVSEFGTPEKIAEINNDIGHFGYLFLLESH